MSDKKEPKFSIADFGVNLTDVAHAGRLDPVIGRDREIDRVTRILARKTKNNPILLGEPGVGKTAIVEGLACRIAKGEVPRALQGKVVFSLNLGSLLAGTGYRGDFEKRLQELIAELRRPGAAWLLFVDEIHQLGKAGKSEGGLDAANVLKPLLARGELPCIGASTPGEWGEMVARDPALERRFQPVEVAEPTREQAIEILRGARDRYERYHDVEITDDALEAAVSISMEQVHPTRRLPDKAFDLIDEGCAALRMHMVGQPSPEAVRLERELAIAQDRFDLDEYARLRAALPSAQSSDRPRLDAGAVKRICGESIGLT